MFTTFKIRDVFPVWGTALLIGSTGLVSGCGSEPLSTSESGIAADRDLRVTNLRRTSNDLIATVCNLGDGPSNPTELEFYDVTDPNQMIRGAIQPVPGLNPAECTDVADFCNPDNWVGIPFSCSGPAAIRVELDPYGTIEESDETNNGIERHFASVSDVEITSIRRNATDFIVNVCNSGEDTAFPMDVQLIDITDPTNFQYGAPANTFQMNAGECTDVTIPCSMGPAGPFSCTDAATILAVVDHYNYLPESNETNNKLEQRFATGLDVELRNLRRTSTDYVVTACNNGTAMLFGSDLMLTDLTDANNPIYGPATTINALNEGECQDIGVPCSPGAFTPFSCEATAVILADADPYQFLEEADEANNRAEARFDTATDLTVSNIRRSATDYLVTACNNGGESVSAEVSFIDLTDPNNPNFGPTAFSGPLVSGACEDLRAPCTVGSFGPFACQGAATVRAEVDPYRFVEESDESNNGVEASFDNGEDLSLVDLRRNATDFVATVCNNGPTFMSGAEVELYDNTDPNQMISGNVSFSAPLNPGQCADVNLPCNPGTLPPFSCDGDTNAMAVADPYNFLAESDESNNTREARFGSLGNRASTLDLTVGTIARDTNLLQYTVEVCNGGTTAGLNPVEITLFQHYPQSANWFTAAVTTAAPPQAGACEIAYLPCGALGDGTCADALELRAVIDSQNQSDEWDEGNNSQIIRFDSQADLSLNPLSRDPLNGYGLDICNNGASDIFNSIDVAVMFRSELSPNWMPMGNFPIGGLPAGQCFTNYISCGTIGDGSCADTVEVRVALDPGAQIAESNEANNTLHQAFSSELDLSIGTISRDPLYGYMADLCNLSAFDFFSNVDVAGLFRDSNNPGMIPAQSTSFGGLPAGQCQPIYFPCGAFGDGTCADPVEVRLVVDSINLIDESNEGNNVSSHRFSSELDLTVQNLDRDLQQFFYTAEVCNPSAVDFFGGTDVTVSFHSSNNPNWTYANNEFVGGLPAGQCQPLYISCGLIGDGSCADTVDIRLDLDPTSTIEESNEDNNSLTARFTSDQDLEVTKMTRDQLNGYRIEVCNAGSADLFSSYDLAVFSMSPILGGWQFAASANISGLPVGQCTEAFVPCGAIGDGTCGDSVQVRVVADSQRFLDELSEENNVLTKFFGVPLTFQTPWMAIEDGSLYTGIGWNYAMGYHFTPNVDGEIRGLGGYFSGTKTVRLFERATGAVLAETQVTSADAWSFTEIPTVVVNAGTEYTVAAYIAGSGGSYRVGIGNFPRTSGDITINSSAYAPTSSNPDAFPSYSYTSAMFGQADVQFVATGAPPAAPVGLASFDPALGVPACFAGEAICDSGSLLDGRAGVGPESDAPNTLDGCADGTAGTYHVDESIDRIALHTADGAPFTAGSNVKIEVNAWAFGDGSSDSLDLYHAPFAGSVNWQYLGTVPAIQSGAQTLSFSFALPAGGGPQQAIRAQWRFSGPAGDPGDCMAGPYNERDDLVFGVQ